MNTISDCCLKNLKVEHGQIFPKSLILYIIYWLVDNFRLQGSYMYLSLRGLTLARLKSSGTISVAISLLIIDIIGSLV